MKNIYIASCTDDGGIYRIETDGKSFEIKEKTVIVTFNYLQAYEIEVSTFIK